MKRSCFSLYAILGILSLSCLAAFADDKKPSVSVSDEKFLKKSAEASRVEVSISELAVQKATRAEVKDLAQKLVTDHKAMSEVLATLATGKGVQISAIIEPSGAARFRDLEKLKGDPFDNAFLGYVTGSHRRMIASFEEAAKNAADAEVKAFAGKNLAMMREHLDKANKLLPETVPPAPIPPI